jgi:hypothetical protein
MRPSASYIVVMLPILGSVTAAAQSDLPMAAAASGRDSATPSLLGTRPGDQVPAPTPIIRETAKPSAMPKQNPGASSSIAPKVPPPLPVTTAPTGFPGKLRSSTSAQSGSPATGEPISLMSTPAPPIAKSGTKAVAPRAISSKLATPDLPADATPADFLRAARGAVAAGRIGAARQALEMAETRLLDREMDAGQERYPSRDLAVKQISEARNALTSNDRISCLRYIEFASQTIGSPLD